MAAYGCILAVAYVAAQIFEEDIAVSGGTFLFTTATMLTGYWLTKILVGHSQHSEQVGQSLNSRSENAERSDDLFRQSIALGLKQIPLSDPFQPLSAPVNLAKDRIVLEPVLLTDEQKQVLSVFGGMIHMATEYFDPALSNWKNGDAFRTDGDKQWDCKRANLARAICHPLIGQLREDPTDENIKAVDNFIQAVTCDTLKMYLHAHFANVLSIHGRKSEAAVACNNFVRLAKKQQRFRKHAEIYVLDRAQISKDICEGILALPDCAIQADIDALIDLVLNPPEPQGMDNMTLRIVQTTLFTLQHRGYKLSQVGTKCLENLYKSKVGPCYSSYLLAGQRQSAMLVLDLIGRLQNSHEHMLSIVDFVQAGSYFLYDAEVRERFLEVVFTNRLFVNSYLDVSGALAKNEPSRMDKERGRLILKSSKGCLPLSDVILDERTLQVHFFILKLLGNENIYSNSRNTSEFIKSFIANELRSQFSLDFTARLQHRLFQLRSGDEYRVLTPNILQDYSKDLPQPFVRRLEKLFPSEEIVGRYRQFEIIHWLLSHREDIDVHHSSKAISVLLEALNSRHIPTQLMLDILQVFSLEECNEYFKGLMEDDRSPLSAGLQGSCKLLSQAGFSPEVNVDFYLLAAMHTLFLSKNLLVQQLRLIPKKWLKSYFKSLFFHPELLKPILDSHFKLNWIDLADGGSAKATWSPLVNELLSTMGASNGVDGFEETSFAKAYQAAMTTPNEEPKSISFDQIIDGWTFDQVLGRTLLFRRDGQYRAIKLQRSDEAIDILWRELRLVQLLKSEIAPEGLLTKWPKPIHVYDVGDLPQEYQAQLKIEIALANGHVNAYVYEFCDRSYFCYLHHRSLDKIQFAQAREAMLHDLFLLARHGIVYTALADLFHNLEQMEERDDQGYYLPLVDLFRNLVSEGSGRLSGMWKAIKYLNARASGLADLADTDLIANIIQNLEESPFRLRKLKGLKGIELFLLAHFAASYLLVDQLTIGRRELKNMNWKDEEYVTELGKQLAAGYTSAVAAFTNLPKETVRPFSEKGGLNWPKMARQMCFWMRNDDTGYLPHVKKRSIPERIFEDASCTVASTDDLRGWNHDHGFMLNPPHPDSGPVNGQHMVKEAERSWYVTALFLAVMKDAQRKAEKWKTRAEQCDEPQKKKHFFKKSLQHQPGQADLIAQLNLLLGINS